jgi:SAM-dependent methyltransferase
MNSERIDQAGLLQHQYKTADNLMARVQLHDRFSTNPYSWFLWVFDQFELPNECQILELGCGPCLLWQKNLNRLPDGWQLTLTDFSPGMLEEGARNLGAYSRNVRFEQVDAQQIPFEDGSFEAVVANHMLYHVPDKSRALGEIQRVLKPGGRFYAATNGARHMRGLSELAAQAFPDYARKIQTTFQRLSFTLENGADLLSPYFEQVSLHVYEDGLHVTESEPLIDYVLSMLSTQAAELNPTHVAAIRQHVQQILAQQGAIHIEKSGGLFIAQKLPPANNSKPDG